MPCVIELNPAIHQINITATSPFHFAGLPPHQTENRNLDNAVNNGHKIKINEYEVLENLF